MQSLATTWKVRKLNIEGISDRSESLFKLYRAKTRRCNSYSEGAVVNINKKIAKAGKKHIARKSVITDIVKPIPLNYI